MKKIFFYIAIFFAIFSFSFSNTFAYNDFYLTEVTRSALFNNTPTVPYCPPGSSECGLDKWIEPSKEWIDWIKNNFICFVIFIFCNSCDYNLSLSCYFNFSLKWWQSWKCKKNYYKLYYLINCYIFGLSNCKIYYLNIWSSLVKNLKRIDFFIKSILFFDKF